MRYIDKNGKAAGRGDVVNINQTVNGQSLFVIFNVNPLDVRYEYDLSREYEYDKDDLLRPSEFTGETEWEIVDNIQDKLEL